MMGYWGEGAKRAYHHTAPINALYSLHEALLIVREEGLDGAWDRHYKNHRALRAGLEAMGLRFVVNKADRLPQLNAVSIPAGVDDAKVGWFAESTGLINDLGIFVLEYYYLRLKFFNITIFIPFSIHYYPFR